MCVIKPVGWGHLEQRPGNDGGLLLILRRFLYRIKVAGPGMADQTEEPHNSLLDTI